MVKNPPAMQETWVQSLGWEDPLEEGMATYSSILAWKNPQGQRSLVGYSPRCRQELDTTEWLSIHTHIHTRLYMLSFSLLGVNHTFSVYYIICAKLNTTIHLYSEKAMAPHSSTVAWKIPRMEEPGRLQTMGSLRVRHDWATSLSLSTFMHWRRKWQPTPVLLPGESHGWRSLVGCSPWGHTETWLKRLSSIHLY